MANPLARAALISQIGGSVTSGIGSYYSAGTQQANLRGQAAVSDANARIYDVNARMAEVSAQSAMSQGNQQIAGLTLKAGQLKGTQRANLAANGVDLGVGSAAEIQASTDIMKDIDVNTLKANAVRTAWGYRTQAINADTRASNSRIDALSRSATASGISPFGSASTSLLGSAGKVAASWYQYAKTMGDSRPNLDTFAKQQGFW